MDSAPTEVLPVVGDHLDRPVGPGAGYAIGDEPPLGGHRRRGVVALVVSLAVVLVGGGAGAAVVLSGRASRHPLTPGRALAVSAAATHATRPSPTPTPQSWASLYSKVSDGVIRIETTACDGGGVGSGFLVAPDLVATVAHVVDGAQNVVLRSGPVSTTGTVVGFDAAHELALVRATSPFHGHVFSLAIRDPQVGDDVAAIGYPLAGDESLTKGSVSGLGRQVDVEGTRLGGLMQTDAAINPGNSGGPLLTEDGTVVGLVEAKNIEGENIGYAIPATGASGSLGNWQNQPSPVHFPHCSTAVGPSGITADVTDDSGSPDGPAITNLFSAYATSINTGSYDAAYGELSPHAQALTSFDRFAGGETSSYLFNIHITTVTQLSSGKDRAEVSFTSVQDPVAGGTGQSCSDWQITYTLVAGGDSGWQIDLAQPHTGSPTPC